MRDFCWLVKRPWRYLIFALMVALLGLIAFSLFKPASLLLGSLLLGWFLVTSFVTMVWAHESHRTWLFYGRKTPDDDKFVSSLDNRLS